MIRSKMTVQLCPFLNAASGEGLQQHVSNRVCLWSFPIGLCEAPG